MRFIIIAPSYLINDVPTYLLLSFQLSTYTTLPALHTVHPHSSSHTYYRLFSEDVLSFLPTIPLSLYRSNLAVPLLSLISLNPNNSLHTKPHPPLHRYHTCQEKARCITNTILTTTLDRRTFEIDNVYLA